MFTVRDESDMVATERIVCLARQLTRAQSDGAQRVDAFEFVQRLTGSDLTGPAHAWVVVDGLRAVACTRCSLILPVGVVVQASM